LNALQTDHSYYYSYVGVEIADFTLPTSLDDMFKFYQRQLGEQTLQVDEEVVTDSYRQEMERDQLDELNQFVTVVDNEDNVEF
jgi:hypothetical protein